VLIPPIFAFLGQLSNRWTVVLHKNKYTIITEGGFLHENVPQALRLQKEMHVRIPSTETTHANARTNNACPSQPNGTEH
jgi:hypothetical protein